MANELFILKRYQMGLEIQWLLWSCVSSGLERIKGSRKKGWGKEAEISACQDGMCYGLF